MMRLETERPQERPDLARLTVDGWTRWLRDELGAWLQDHPQSIEPRPFDPLFIAFDDQNPGGALAAEIRLSCQGRVSPAAQAAGRLLRSWTGVLDSVRGAELLLKLCQALDTPRLAAAVRTMLTRMTPLTVPEAQRLGRAVVVSVEGRLSDRELGRLAVDLGAAGLYDSLVAAELLAVRSRSRPNRLGLLIQGTPFENLDGHSQPYHQLVGRLLETHSAARLEEFWMGLDAKNVRRKLVLALADLTVDRGLEDLIGFPERDAADSDAAIGWDLTDDPLDPGQTA